MLIGNVVPSAELLTAIAEQLKLPLLQIARSAELARLNQDVKSLELINQTADTALKLVDSFLLSLDFQDQISLEFEPVSIAAVLQETANNLSPLAKRYACDIEINLAGRYGPVMASQAGLRSVFILLGQSLIEAMASSKSKKLIVLGVHRSRTGLVAGVYSPMSTLSTDTFRRARALVGAARQPAPSISSVSGAGVFLADTLCNYMNSPLKVSHHGKLAGLAATFIPSRQLELI